MRFLRYAKYLFRHKWYVFIEACKLGIPWRGFIHDMSKFLPSEFIPYADYFYGNGNSQFSKAWLTHQHKNQHHWQYWILKNDDGTTEALPMPSIFAKEMVADWKGAGRAMHGVDDSKQWYEKIKDSVAMHIETRKLVEELLRVKAEQPAQ